MRRARLRSLCLAGVAAGALAAGGCSGPPPVPQPGDLFDPAPGHNFHAATGLVRVRGLEGHTVCYTTDGSAPQLQNGACAGPSTMLLGASSALTLGCGTDTSASAIRGVKLAFDWMGTNGPTVQTVAGNFTLDCTAPEPDRDGDGVPDSRDNCPDNANADQADANGNSIGDACEAVGAPDADMDGRPDAQDNCPTVWNVNQGDDDHDGIGNVCDPTPRGVPPLPWDNGVLAHGFALWKDQLQCSLNGCHNPGGAGSWHGTCDNGGTVDWNVSLSGVRAISVFTFDNCGHTVMVPVHDYAADPANTNPMATRQQSLMLVGEGSVTQDTDFGGNGAETGMVSITGDFTGTVVSHVQIRGASRGAGSYFSVACTADPLEQEQCAPGNILVNYQFPEWTCEPGGCPAPPAPLTDRDGDGVFDPYDNCPDVPNPTQANADFDMLGDACDSSTSTADMDHDGVPDTGDNCPSVANPDQADSDHDGLGDACDTMSDPDTDMDGVIDARDNCPRVANPTQTDTDMDGLGDACDPTPRGTPTFSLLKMRLGRCLYDNGSDVRSTASCDAAATNQQWEVLDAGSGRRAFRNLQTMRCLAATSWGGAIDMAPCNTMASVQQWTPERFTQNGFDVQYPMRLRSVEQGYCLYTDGTGNVFAAQGNCGLLGSENNLKLGIYPAGDFTMAPVQP